MPRQGPQLLPGQPSFLPLPLPRTPLQQSDDRLLHRPPLQQSHDRLLHRPPLQQSPDRLLHRPSPFPSLAERASVRIPGTPVLMRPLKPLTSCLRVVGTEVPPFPHLEAATAVRWRIEGEGERLLFQVEAIYCIHEACCEGPVTKVDGPLAGSTNYGKVGAGV